MSTPGSTHASPTQAGAASASLPKELLQLKSVVSTLRTVAGGVKKNKKENENMIALAGEFESSLCASWEAKRLDNLPLFVRPAVELATRAYKDYISSVQDHIGKWNTSKLKTRLECTTAATEALRNLLQIQGGRCGLIDDPQREIKFALPKGYKEPTEFSGISSLRTFYQGFKLTLATTVNATDGSVIPMGPQPIKAITQTALQVIKHVEESIELQDRIGKLQKRIQDMWDIVHGNHQAPFAVGKLEEYVEKFLYRLQRTVIRLHLILAMRKIKRFIVLAAIKDMINEESEEFRHTMVELEDMMSTNGPANFKA
ncbi:hypothetical protein AURDEDRAFT_161575 [Auricularia subglabra TFB-10046 SS5]|nr:hypothetical protein AURDEDRAFT_161575 [Auricularia subglabra TFB-10046 SS5]